MKGGAGRYQRGGSKNKKANSSRVVAAVLVVVGASLTLPSSIGMLCGVTQGREIEKRRRDELLRIIMEGLKGGFFEAPQNK